MERGILAAVVAAACLSAGAGRAAAQDDDAADSPLDDRKAFDDEDSHAFTHRGQVELHLQGGIGYRGIFPYHEEYCGDLKDDGGNKADCLGRSPFGLDVGLGYGVIKRLEIFLEMRFGLERDFGTAPGADGPRALWLSPGVKLYIAEIGATQFFSTLQLPIDFTSFDQADKNDFGIRNLNGFQLDLHRTFGLYIFFGEEVSWRRWLRFEVEAGLGAQVRFP